MAYGLGSLPGSNFPWMPRCTELIKRATRGTGRVCRQPSRPSRYLDRAGPRHRCRADHPVAMRLITRAEVAIEDNALTHHRDDQGYDYGDNRAVLLHVASFQLT